MHNLTDAFRQSVLPLLRGSLKELGKGVEDVLAELDQVPLHGLSPVATSGVLLRCLQRFAQTLTDADCTFLRRVNVDGSLERLPDLDPYWRPGRAEVGVVPWLKQSGTGVSGWVVRKGSGQPIVISDVKDMNEDFSAANAHMQSLALCADRQEAEFLDFIAAEACVPLVVHGKTVAVVVAVRGEKYPPDQANSVREWLNKWGPALIPMYAVAATLAEVGAQDELLKSFIRAWPQITTNEDDKDVYRRMATVLTCDKGLGWHRAMIFRFRGRYPADAECVMALGGSGDADWSRVQTSVSDQFESLEQYLAACLTPDFGFNDPLYAMVHSGERSWIVSPAALQKCGWLTSSFEGPRPLPNLPDGVLPLRADNAFLGELRASDPGGAFSECPAECSHWVAPLVHAGNPLGFVLVDRPYAHRCDLPLHLPFTRLACDMFAGLLAFRGADAGAVDAGLQGGASL